MPNEPPVAPYALQDEMYHSVNVMTGTAICTKTVIITAIGVRPQKLMTNSDMKSSISAATMNCGIIVSIRSHSRTGGGTSNV